MPGWSKHRDEKIDVPIDFTDSLDAGDGLSSVDTVTIVRNNGGGDATTEFGTTGGTINGDQVEVTFDAASTGSATDQSPELYLVYCKVTTSNGDTLIAQDENNHLPRLNVNDRAG